MLEILCNITLTKLFNKLTLKEIQIFNPKVIQLFASINLFMICQNVSVTTFLKTKTPKVHKAE